MKGRDGMEKNSAERSSMGQLDARRLDDLTQWAGGLL